MLTLRLMAGWCTAAALVSVVPLAAAQDGGRPGGPRMEPAPQSEEPPPPPKLRDPYGTVLIGISGGVSTQSDGSTVGSVGGHVGYAVLTGVVPGVRGNAFFGDFSGGEVAGILWLTPPLEFSIVPFGIGEVGYIWQSVGDVSANGMLYGVGGGLHFGKPTNPWSVRAGVVYRYYDIDGVGTGYFSPVLAASFRL